MRRWHANKGRAMASITKAVEKPGTAPGLTHRQSGPVPSGGFRLTGGPARAPLSACLMVTKSVVELSEKRV